MPRSVLLVGSVPFATTEEVFARCAEILGGYVKRLPDGERGGWLPGEDFRRMRGLTEGRTGSILNPPISRTLRLDDASNVTDLDFETLHYAPHALHSYAIFQRLRAAGVIPAGVRYQVTIPTAFTGSIYFDHDQMRQLWPAYERALFRDLRRIIASISPLDLAIAWDVVEFGISLANPDPLEVFTFEELADALARAVNLVPPDVDCGMHFCYGGHNSNGMLREGLNRRELGDSGLMVRFFNAVASRVARPITWLHLPVPRPHHDEGYFRPLTDLDRDALRELYLGLLYIDDGVDTTMRKIETAAKFAGSFGVGAACGLNPFVSGVPAERLPDVLAYHRRIAEIG